MPKHTYATVNGVRLHYAVEGSKGPVMLFLHGFPEFWYAWKESLAEFSKTHRALALDMRGYNLSEKPPKVEDYAMVHLVADIDAFLEKVSPRRKAILVAHDWGGAVAWAFAALHPERLEKLVIVNAPHPSVFSRELATNPAQQKASGYMDFFRSPGAEDALRKDDFAALAAAVFAGSTKPEAFTDEDRKAYRAAWGQPGALTGGLNYYRAMGQPGLPSPLPKVRVPTLVLWGEKDTALLTGNLDGLEKFVPQLTVQRIPGGSHWVVHEEPERIHRAIREFLNRRVEVRGDR